MTDGSISIEKGTDELRCAIRDLVAVITLNRPQARNSLVRRETRCQLQMR
jgi:enoyl-CoA hydratase/carnithine racemase